MPIVFAALVAASLALWATGRPAPTVLAAALPCWLSFAVLLLPKLRRYRAAMGLAPPPDASPNARPDALGPPLRRSLRRLRLRLAGAKVPLVGLATSALPFLGAAAQWLGGQDLGLFFAPRQAGRIGFLLGAATFLLPFVASWLHLDALGSAAETVPAPRASAPQPPAGPYREAR